MPGSGSKLPHRPPSPNFIYSLPLGNQSQLKRRQEMEAWAKSRDEAKKKALAGKKPLFIVGKVRPVPSKSNNFIGQNVKL